MTVRIRLCLHTAKAEPSRAEFSDTLSLETGNDFVKRGARLGRTVVLRPGPEVECCLEFRTALSVSDALKGGLLHQGRVRRQGRSRH